VGKKKKRKREDDLFDFLDDEVVLHGGPVRWENGWPVSVPVLDETDLCRAQRRADGRMDLAGWLEETFDRGTTVTRTFRTAYSTLLEVLSQRSGVELSSLWIFLEGCEKGGGFGLRWQAAAWNEAMRRLGYKMKKEVCREPER
jgi:hypothetical protein